MQAMRAVARKQRMKINSNDFRVHAGKDVDLKKWPTRIDPGIQVKGTMSETSEKTRCATERDAATRSITTLCFSFEPDR
jgi:hypothetical protein